MSVRRIVLVVLAALVSVAARASLAEGVDKGFAGLGADATGFDQPIPGTPLAFPRDLGPHPGFRTEWWYLTANLVDGSGAAYGVQWTLFRQAGAPRDERQGWANQTAWMGHAAVTTATEHLFAETFARGGVGQAGVTAQPFRAWIDDWILEARQEASGAGLDAPGAALSHARISAGGPGFRYTFDLAADKPLVLHGDNGFSRKSDDGRASYYFSQLLQDRWRPRAPWTQGCAIGPGVDGSGMEQPTARGNPKRLGLVFAASFDRREGHGFSAERRNVRRFLRRDLDRRRRRAADPRSQ
jgi:predicted secreted hydrolase